MDAPPNKRLKRHQDDETTNGNQASPSSFSREYNARSPDSLAGSGLRAASGAAASLGGAPEATNLQQQQHDEQNAQRDLLILQALSSSEGGGSGGDILSNLGVASRPDLLQNLRGSSSSNQGLDLQVLLMLRAANQGAPLAPGRGSATAGTGAGSTAASSQLAEIQALRYRAAAGLGAAGGLLPSRTSLPDSRSQQAYSYLNELEALRLRGGLLPQGSRNLESELLQRAVQQQRQASLAAVAAATDYGNLSSFAAGARGNSQGNAWNRASGTIGRHTGGLVDSLFGGGSASSAPQFQSGSSSLRASLPESNEPDGQVNASTSFLNSLAAPAPSASTKLQTQLPPVEEGDTPHYSQRICVPLAIEEDPNWLSERQCFIRSELLEVVRASHEEVLVRSSSKSIAYQQVGIRCRYCAHMQPGSRAIRSSAYPSSIRQAYQSFTMMVRDHFANCSGIPSDKKNHFIELKGLTSPSSSLSRQYWTYAAKKLGMVDSEYGIMINEETQAEAMKTPPFGTTAEETAAVKNAPVEMLVERNDQASISPYLCLLMSQVQIVHLLPSERVGKRKDAAAGLPGFGCMYCAKAGRLGFCRMFPLNKRSLPDKVNDMFAHLQRCPSCPTFTKTMLDSRRHENMKDQVFAERDREFIDRIWNKLGRDSDEAFQK